MGGRQERRREESRSLLRSYGATRDRVSRERLVELHLPLVRALARRYANCGEQLEDLVQVGSIGLIEAIDRYDSELGSDLVHFAAPTICGEIKRHLRDRSSTVRIPRRLDELDRRLRPSRATLVARLSRAPTVAELAHEAGVTEADVAEAAATERVRAPVPLPDAEGASGNIDGAVVAEDPFASSDDRMLLSAGFRTLDARQRRVLHLRYFAGLSQAEIARELGVSEMQVSRTVRVSLERLRGALGERDRSSRAALPVGSSG
jgi:RNA polymerase sigma-B factor